MRKRRPPATRAPTRSVAITSRGRSRVAVISAEECERLRRDRPALRVEDLPDELAALADAIAAAAPPEEARRFDGEVD